MGPRLRSRVAAHVRSMGTRNTERRGEVEAAELRADTRGETETEGSKVTPEELAELGRLATRLEGLGKRYAIFLSPEDKSQLWRAVRLARKAVALLSTQGKHLLGSG